MFGQSRSYTRSMRSALFGGDTLCSRKNGGTVTCQLGELLGEALGGDTRGVIPNDTRLSSSVTVAL